MVRACSSMVLKLQSKQDVEKKLCSALCSKSAEQAEETSCGQRGGAKESLSEENDRKNCPRYRYSKRSRCAPSRTCEDEKEIPGEVHGALTLGGVVSSGVVPVCDAGLSSDSRAGSQARDPVGAGRASEGRE